VAHGIADARLTAAGFGDSKPVADNATEDGRSKNRRVDLVRH
jgi:outer membrane protein OmpA-like peptidoglycan-associated protein